MCFGDATDTIVQLDWRARSEIVSFFVHNSFIPQYTIRYSMKLAVRGALRRPMQETPSRNLSGGPFKRAF